MSKGRDSSIDAKRRFIHKKMRRNFRPPLYTRLLGAQKQDRTMGIDNILDRIPMKSIPEQKIGTKTQDLAPPPKLKTILGNLLEKLKRA